MNCQQIQDSIPLYVGSDLEESRARLVAAHVQTCETCSDVAREYRETRQLIQTFVPPPFTDDFYAAMRQGVWQNLEKKSPGPAFSSIIADLFRPRLAWAVATAGLIAVSVVGIYMIGHRSVPAPVVSHQPSTTHTTQDDQPTTSSQNDASSVRASALNGSKSRPANVPPFHSRRKRSTIHDRVNLTPMPTVAAVSPAAISAPPSSDSRRPNGSSSEALQAPLRMEIQTKNPNIRIIWFASRDAKSPAPNSKGI